MKELLETVKNSSESLNSIRSMSRANAVASVRELETYVVDALCGERLKGLPNLMRGWKPFFAARLRGNIDNQLPLEKHETSGRPVIVIDDTGMLMLVRRSRCGGVESEVAQDEDLIAEDVQEYISKMGSILHTHIAICRRGIEKYSLFNRLANGLRRLLLVSLTSDRAE